MLDWSPIDLAVRDAVRQFIDKEVRPHVDALESGEMEPYPIIRKMFATFGIDALAKEGLQKQIEKKKAREAALAAGEQPAESKKSDGGGAMGLAGGSAGMGFVLTSEISRVCMGLVTGMGVSMGLTVPTIASRGTAAQMECWLPELVTYEKVGAWAITEPDSGSDAFGGMKTYVTRDGEDYILNGQKTFITNGPDADVIVVYAKLNEGAGKDSVDPRDRKVLTFVLDKGMEGFTQSKPFRKMGIHSSRTGQLFFENVRLGKDRLLGETETNDQGDGRDSARANFSMERIGVAALALGVIEECLRLSLDYAKSRTLWGKEIAQFQLIQLKLAKMEVARLNVRNMLFHAIESLSENKTPSLAEDPAIKLYCSEAATDVAMDAVQLFGGNGYMTEYRVEQLARDAKSLMIYAGSNEVQITHIAKGLLADKAR
ncbi:acyl-CoA dehydrogenase family protein [Mycobacteroides abscessus]